MGAFTFKNTSTIDYSVFSTESLKFLQILISKSLMLSIQMVIVF